jgi:hypothetical protein
MNRWIMPGFGGCAAIVILTALWQAGAQTPPPGAPAAAVVTATDWGTPDGGGVVIKANGSYSILCDDMTDKSSVFSEGQVAGRSESPDGTRTFRLRPTTPRQEGWMFEVIAKPDGTGELWVTKGGARHMVATLKH